jgi:hypothetical protein
MVAVENSYVNNIRPGNYYALPLHISCREELKRVLSTLHAARIDERQNTTPPVVFGPRAYAQGQSLL